MVCVIWEDIESRDIVKKNGRMSRRRKSGYGAGGSGGFPWLRVVSTLLLTGLLGTAGILGWGKDAEAVVGPIGRMGSWVSAAGVTLKVAESKPWVPETQPVKSAVDGSGPASDDSHVLCNAEDEKKVLFIGNSYTFYHDMPRMVVDIAGSAGCKLKVAWATRGGYRLGLHAQDPVTLAAIQAESWDLVVLQNQSQRPSFKLDDVVMDSLPVVEHLAKVIRQNNPETELLYYVTWGRRDGDQLNCAYYDKVCSFDGHTQALRDGYSLYAEATDGRLADVGRAFQLAVQDEYLPFDPYDLYDRDGTHPSIRGSYLAASVFFYEIFGISPEGLAFPTLLTAEESAYLQQVAAASVDGRELTPPGASVITEEKLVATCSGEDCGPTDRYSGAPTTMVLFKGTCSDWYLRTNVQEVARVTTELSCSTGACTTGSVNTWLRDRGDAVAPGTYSVFVNIDADRNGSSGPGDMEACENSAFDVGSGKKVRVTRFYPFDTYS